MSEPTPLSPVALRQKREHTIQLLCEHFANDHLEAEELEALIDRAHAARSLAELDTLVAGLPTAPAPSRDPFASHDLARPRDLAPLPLGGQSVVVAVMGGAERRYDVLPSREINVVAVMGGVFLDFRNARFPQGVTELRIFALMGGVEVVVPPDVQVDSNGIGIMGGVEIPQRLPGESGRDAKTRRKYEDRVRRLGRGDLDDL